MEPIKLTQYSHGAGCGCKISPAILDKILHSPIKMPIDPRLLVGNAERDDAAVWDLNDGNALISTTDFFMPIVDDPYDFGRIASANAISDVYAMGGKPVLAIAILGWLSTSCHPKQPKRSWKDPAPSAPKPASASPAATVSTVPNRYSVSPSMASSP